ncbi:hypothetical protein [Marinobacter nauticus]|uniref:hypothetical protein n=1 Tax=Marinobacter nauticus TaxID=2743 RepID=UPI001C58EB06|nr:hypothetical protein [Marinobacter nauticus]MBW3198132.1 hypothetical protein [Marinobacter nauticus]MBY6183542.1 hypothetical protein [Marinobacter nauticus]
MIPAKLRNKYIESKTFLEMIKRSVNEIARPFCEENDFLFSDRIKTEESICEKIQTGRFKSWSDLDDLYACTIIINTPRQEQLVLDFLDQKFDLDNQKSRFRNKARKPAESFRFDSTRAVCKLKPPLHAREQTPLFETSFEVQIKTIFDHAWSKSTHALAYKSKEPDWKRQRLAAQLKASVEQIETLINAFTEATKSVDGNQTPDIEDIRLISRFFLNTFEEELLPKELEPSDWGRFCNNIYDVIKMSEGIGISHRVRKNLNSLQDTLDKFKEHIEKTGRKSIPVSITLYQFFTFWLANEEILKSKHVSGYTLLFTEDVSVIFPENKLKKNLFKWD